MQPGTRVLLVCLGQLAVGLTLLSIYEAYKHYYYNNFIDVELVKEEQQPTIAKRIGEVEQATLDFENPADLRSSLGIVFYFAVFNNVFAIIGIAGILQAQRELLFGFFGCNTALMVVAFHYFVDLCADTTIKYAGEPLKLTGYERGAAVLLAASFVLSALGSLFGMQVLQDPKATASANRIPAVQMSDLS